MGKIEEDALHFEHTLELNSPLGKNIELLAKRKSKKINRAELRGPWKKQRVLRKGIPNPIQKPSNKRINLTPGAIARWGISIDELKEKKQDLLMRKRLTWS